MEQSFDAKKHLIRAVRIVLVFLLVFWTSFRVEALAYAQINPVDYSEYAGKLVNISVYEILESAPDVVEGDESSDSDDAETDDSETGNARKSTEQLSKYAIASASSTERGMGETQKLSAAGQTRKFIAVPVWSDGSSGVSGKTGDIGVLDSRVLSWAVESPEEGVVGYDVDETGVFSISGAKGGAVTVTCNLTEEALRANLPASNLPGNGKVQIAFDVIPPRVTNVQLLDDAGRELAGETSDEHPYVLPSGEFPLSQVFHVEASVRDDVLETDTVCKNLVEANAAGISFAWSVDDDQIASMDAATNTLTMHAEGWVTATLSLWPGVSAEAPSSGVTRLSLVARTAGAPEKRPTGEPEEPSEKTPVDQGESHPQESLQVVFNGEFETADSADSADSPSSKPGSASSSASSSSTSSSSSASSGQAERRVAKTYTADELLALGSDVDTSTMYKGGAFIAVTGQGPTLRSVLEDAGVPDFSQVESLTFDNALGESVSITYGDLEAAGYFYPRAAETDYKDSVKKSPMIAVNSLVRGYQDGTGAFDAEDAAIDYASGNSIDPALLLDNARFRLLFGCAVDPTQSIADPDALRWIDTITVNVKAADADPGFDTDISVWVDYKPVALGQMAVLSAIPVNIGGARFDFYWQELAPTSGASWVDLPDGNTQVYRKMTDEAHLGYFYRVRMETNAVDEKRGEKIWVVSEPVTLSAANETDLTVKLEYDPPWAGDVAVFVSSLSGAKDGAKFEYEWQFYQDGFADWQTLQGRTGDTLRIPTEEIEENDDSGDDDEAAPLTLVRVVVREISGGEVRTATSNAVPLTVRVGEGGGDSDPSDEKPTNNQPKPKGPWPEAPTPKDPDPIVPTPITPIYDDPVTEPEEDPEQAAEPSSAGDGARGSGSDLSEIHVNPEVTAKINDQQQELKDYVESNVPGARWTSLSSANPADDEVRNLLAGNPFAPLVIPGGLGITAVGVVEKLLVFRRQVK